MQLSQIEDIGIEEIALSNLYVQKALVNLLIEKGILTGRELLEEVKGQLNSNKLECLSGIK
ncbi:MAG: hypothetical protein IBX72_04435 [Nitrospirae bacterium]|nr:hypothetical protein [Nitrospirota bacterium]